MYSFSFLAKPIWFRGMYNYGFLLLPYYITWVYDSRVIGYCNGIQFGIFNLAEECDGENVSILEPPLSIK